MKKFVFLLGLCGFGSLFAVADDYIPLELTGYNADLVVGQGETGSKNYLDNNDWSFFSTEIQSRGGLPQSITAIRTNIPYRFADFSGNNALHVCTANKDQEKGTSYGTTRTLELVTPLQAKQIWLLGTAGNGPAGMKITVNYTDGTSGTTVESEMPDWSKSSDSSTSYWGLGRIDKNGHIDGAYTFSLFEHMVKADSEKWVKSVTVSITDKGSFLSVFAVTALDKDAVVARDKTLYFITDSHLDSQWNWTVKTTIDEYVLKTMTQTFPRFEDPESPNFRFNFEGAIKYKWMKEYYPEEFAKVQEYVKAGRWNVSGGSLDANDVNTPSAESFIRNCLLGQNFYWKELGVRGGKDIMLPDCFGFSWALPTLSAHCGMIGFHSQKLSWGSAWSYDDLPPFAMWEGVDGSQIFAVFKPGAYDAHEAYRKDMTYDSGIFNEIVSNNDKYDLPVAFRYVGTRGDRGGGIDKETADWLSKSVDSDGPVEVKVISPTEMFEEVYEKDLSKLEVIRHGLPMKAHGVGAYTSRTMLKYWNRKTELLAGATEKSSVAADWLGSLGYQTEAINEAWTRLIWHQFHDDLPGTCINPAYIYTCNDLVLSQLDLSRTLNNAVGAVARSLNTNDCENTPVVVYNPLSIDRTDVVEATAALAGNGQNLIVTDKDGQQVPAQILKQADGNVTFIFLATVPSLGYAAYDVRLSDQAAETSSSLAVSTTGMENDRYKVTVNAQGDVSSVIDKQQGNRELLSAPIRMALLFDESLTWPSWEIHGDQLQKEPRGYVDENVRVSVAENGPLRVSLKVERTKEGSTFVQYIRLASAGASDRIDFVNEVNWQTKERLLKAEFPLTASNPKATYDLSIGAEENNNSAKYDARNAICEFLGHQWADVTDRSGDFGVSILNDCKYGWDKQTDNTIRLTLIHTPKVGGNYVYQGEQDLGLNRFTYSFFGHSGKWGESTQWEAEKLNQPMLAYQTTRHEGALGKSFGFASVNTRNVGVKALKKAENSDEIVIRVYELTGGEEDVTITFPVEIVSAREVNGVEEEVGAASFSGNDLTFHITKYQPKTFAVRLASAPAAATANAAPSSVKVDLEYNIDVMSTDEDRSDAEVDFAYPSELIPAECVVDGVAFSMGSGAENLAKNAVQCKGQTIALPQGHEATKLYLLAASTTPKHEAVFKVNDRENVLNIEYYGDYVGVWSNSEFLKTTYKLENTALSASHRHNVESGENESYQFLYVFKYVIPVTADAQTLTLPADDSILVFAATMSDNTNDDTTPISEVTKILTNQDTESSYQEIVHADELLMPKVVKASGMTGSDEAPRFVLDDMPYTKWCDDKSSRKWIEFQFDEPKKITQWYVMHAGLESKGVITGECYLQRYVNGGWVDVDGIFKNTDNVTNRVLEVPVVTDRVRLRIVYGQQGNNNSAARISEFHVYGTTATEEDMQAPTIISRTPTEGYGKRTAHIHSYSACVNRDEDPCFLLAGGLTKKWCDNTTEEPWAIIELDGIYSVNRFDIYDGEYSEPTLNSDSYWIYVSTTGTRDEDFVEVVHQSGGGETPHKVAELETPVDARYVKLKLSRVDNAVRIYGFDIWGKLKEKTVRPTGGPVSLFKTITGCHDLLNDRETPFTLIDGVTDDKNFKWCFHRGAEEKDPVKWVIIDLEDEYDVNKFVIYDAKVNEAEYDNMGGYLIWTSTVAPTEDEMDGFKLAPGGENWTKVVDVEEGGAGEAVKRHTLETPVRARYIKLEVPCDRVTGTTRLFEFEVYDVNTSGIVDEKAGQTVKVYPNPVAQGKKLHIDLDGDAVVRIYSIDGGLVKQEAVSGSCNISTDGITAGTYILQVTGKSNKHCKLIVR